MMAFLRAAADPIGCISFVTGMIALYVAFASLTGCAHRRGPSCGCADVSTRAP